MTFGNYNPPKYPPPAVGPASRGLLSPYNAMEQAAIARGIPPHWLQEINVPGITPAAPTLRVIDWYMDFVVNFDCVGPGDEVRRKLIYIVAEQIDPDYRKTGTTNIYLRTPMGHAEVRNRFATVTKARDKLTVGRVAETVYTVENTMVNIHPMPR